MSTKSPQPSPTATQEYEKEFEQIDLGPVQPNVTIKPISDEVSRHGVQNGTGRRIVTKEEAEGYTAYAYTTRLKWGILTVLWMVSSSFRHS